jgi:hypothetical protein
VGKTMGLTALATTAATAQPLTAQEFKQTVEEIKVTVPAGRGVEYKFGMAQFKKMKYQWQTDGGAVYFDLHGEPEGDTTGYFESYAIATLSSMTGSYTTPFAGVHGWYWKNTSDEDVIVTLKVEGEYRFIGLKK